MQILTPPSPRRRAGFLVPRWSVEATGFAQGIPFRCLPVAAALFDAGNELVLFDQELDLDREDRSAELRAALEGAGVVFLWMNELHPRVQSLNALRLAEMVKRWRPDTLVVAGGALITIVPPSGLPLDGPIDAYVRGPGERACVELLDALEAGDSLEGISGLVWRDGETRSSPIARRQRVRPLSPDFYRAVDLAPFVQRGGIFGNDQDTFNVSLAYGCAKRCTFCYWRNFEPSWLDAEAIVDLVADLRARYGVRQYHLAELDFAADRRRVLAMARLWAERLPDCTWFALMSPVDAARFTDEEWDLLAAGGCRKIELGTESGSAEVLASMGKRHRPEDALRISREALRRGIVPMHNFVFGTPRETARDRRATLRLIHALWRLSPEWTSFTFRFFQPTWDTPLGDEAIAQEPDYPRDLRELLERREPFGDADGRGMGWIGARDEREIKALVYYFLPMIESKLAPRSAARRWLYRALKRVAALRLRSGFFGLGLDRWLFGRWVRGGLANTYTA